MEKIWDAVRKWVFEVSDSREIHWGLGFQLSLMGLPLRLVYGHQDLRKGLLQHFSLRRELQVVLPGFSIFLFLSSLTRPYNRALMLVSLPGTLTLWCKIPWGWFPDKETLKHLCVRCSSQIPGCFHVVWMCGPLSMPTCTIHVFPQFWGKHSARKDAQGGAARTLLDTQNWSIPSVRVGVGLLIFTDVKTRN
jgi:hypothetical protein